MFVLFFLRGALDPTVCYADDDDSTALDSISGVNTKIRNLTTAYRNELPLLGTTYFIESVDYKLISARERGPGEFQNCLANIQLELKCLELEGKVKKRMFRLLSREKDLSSFFYNTDHELRTVISDVVETEDNHYCPNCTPERNSALEARLNEILASTKTQYEARGSNFYQWLLYTAKTGNPPY